MPEKGWDYFNALYDVARTVNGSLEPGEVLERIVAAVKEAMCVKAAVLRVLGGKGRELRMGACVGLSTGYIRKGPVTVKDSRLDQRALTGETIYLRDAQTDGDFQYGDRARDEGIRSVLVVPLMVEGRAVGVLRAYADDVREFDAHEIRFLEAVANLSAVALENARLHQALKTDYNLLLAYSDRLDDN